ncbi:MAG: hypothetical protein KF802_04130 [Bdellovibrionaceae bacterium]|nr:hypothetical protein [Pseudobdellovibrionaceae bacterium]MBX3034252.1 hypothetical protein [Pseudobdellovibrionaceae bacterium]
MRTADQKNLTVATSSASEADWAVSAPMTHRAYHEMADFPVVETDVMSVLESNMQMLEDLQGRLSFLMRETRYLLKA